MRRYAQMIRPDIAMVTAIGSDHNRSLQNLEVTRSEKSKMVQRLRASGIAVLNGDDPNVVWMKSQTPVQVITCGINQEKDVRASDIALDWPTGTRSKFSVNGQTLDLKVRLIGRHMIYPILAAAAVASAEGFTLDRILQSLSELAPTARRMQPVQPPNGAIILWDDYKSGSETSETAFDVLAEIPASRK